MSVSNLVNAAGVSLSFGTRTIISDVSLGLAAGEKIGVVGRNGDGKSTLLRLLTKQISPDAGQITHTNKATIGYMSQVEAECSDTVGERIGGKQHEWAAEREKREIVAALLGDIDLAAPVTQLSGGERRRVELTRLLLGDFDLLVLDEPTNHLDVEVISWLAEHLRKRACALLLVSHDRWLLDEVCDQIWEVHNATVSAYEGGYAAFVLARTERLRQAAVTAQKAKNLMRKELAWLRRGPPARTSKPKFRIAAASVLIEQEPPARDSLQLREFATKRLGKDVFDLQHVNLGFGDRTLLQDLTWSIGPGDRIGLVGVNGAGKTTLFRLLTGELKPDSGRIKRGKTLHIGQLEQRPQVPDPDERVLDHIAEIKRSVNYADGKSATASQLLEGFGFTGSKLAARVGELSGGELRRLSFLRLLLAEPNVLCLDEPTNDLDIDTLQVLEDYLDSWPGTLLVSSHDRYFLERVCDVTYALLGDGSCVLLPGGVPEYLERRSQRQPTRLTTAPTASSTAQDERSRRKLVARLESQMEKAERRIRDLHTEMAQAATDYVRLGELQTQLDDIEAKLAGFEDEWLAASSD